MKAISYEMMIFNKNVIKKRLFERFFSIFAYLQNRNILK